MQGPMRSAGRMGAVPADFTQRGVGEECSHQDLGVSARPAVLSVLDMQGGEALMTWVHQGSATSLL